MIEVALLWKVVVLNGACMHVPPALEARIQNVWSDDDWYRQRSLTLSRTYYACEVDQDFVGHDLILRQLTRGQRKT